MNLLIDLVPKTITIDNKEYEINSDFRTSILFELLMQDKSIKDNDKIYLALELYYPNIPDDINSAIEKMLWFYRCGKDLITSKKIFLNYQELKSKRKGKGKSDIKIYSFEYDDDYIYAAFMDQYGIDLQDIKYLHWWKFKAMFRSLKEDTEIVKIMRYRSMDLSKIKDKDSIDKYLSRIIINTAIDFIRKNSKMIFTDDECIKEVESEVNSSDINYAVDNLEEDLKSIIVLKYFHGYKISEVAEILDISISTVKNRMHKALKQLRVEIKEEIYE